MHSRRRRSGWAPTTRSIPRAAIRENLHNPQIDTGVPQPISVDPTERSSWALPRGPVISLGIDVNNYSASIGVDRSRRIALVLTSDMGTPNDPSDDCDART